MTKWTIVVESGSAEDDSKVLKLMQQAGKLGLRYAVSSKEIAPPSEARVLPIGREGGTK